jgi:pyrroline-5-carboxylate reductase
MKPIVFLGGGRITSVLVEGLRRSAYRGTLIVHDHNSAKLRALRKFKVDGESNLASAVARAGLLIVAVRPRGVKALLQEASRARGSARKRSASRAKPLTAVSLAAGVPLSVLHRWFPDARWTRAMPSPVCRSARGLTALAWGPGLTASQRGEIRSFFTRVGSVVEIPESQFNAFTVVYSSSHGYHALSALADAGVRAGLRRSSALRAAAHALEGGIRYWRESGADLAELLHEAATPGGIAAATMNGMDRAGYRKAIVRGVAAGMKQMKRVARQL